MPTQQDIINQYKQLCSTCDSMVLPIYAYLFKKMCPDLPFPEQYKKYEPLLKNKKFLHIIKQLTELTIEQLSTPPNSNKQ